MSDEKPELPDMPERLLLDLRTDCNLKCPKCLLHGQVIDEELKKKAIGTMNREAAMAVLDEVMASKPLVQPSWWGEPLLAPDLPGYITAMKERGIPVCMNTNGLTLKPELAQFFVDIKLDTIFFSLDATTPETLILTRGIDKLAKIEKNLKMMLEIRGENKYPRIGATFTVEDTNIHELDDFVAKWTPIVDVVRIGYVFEDGHLSGVEVPEERVPCKLVYQTMPIRYNGDASLCCFDGTGETTMGNIFRDGGIKNVWHGEKFSEIRKLHEEGRWDEIDACKNCNAWAGPMYEEEVTDDLLIRRSSQFTYYNRIDRLDSWDERLRGHEAPDHEQIAARKAS